MRLEEQIAKVMVRRRKTKQERRSQWSAAQSRAWQDFEAKFREVKNYTEARIFVLNPSKKDSPGRLFYTNFIFFLERFAVSSSSSQKEKTLYIEFIKKLVSNGEVKSDMAEKVIADLEKE